jgi:hypothetical protein
LLASLALILGLAGAQTSSLAPSLSVDLDGDGIAETVAADSGRGFIRLQVHGANGKKTAETRAPAPASDIVNVALTSASLGSAGSLLEVSASTDASDCHTVWRYRADALERLPIRDAGGRELPDCSAAGEWNDRWEREVEGRPPVYVRERTESVAGGIFRKKSVFAFAGFSLDFDPNLSVSEINGVPIPSWYHAVLYTSAALETLYSRFDLAALKPEPTLTIETDRERGVFALRWRGPAGETVASVEAYAAGSEGTAILGARAATKTAHVNVRLGGDGNVPVEVRVTGLGPALDRIYAPAGSWRGRARMVFPTAADELVSEDLAGVWNDERGQNVSIEVEGAPPYRVRIGSETFTPDMERALPPADLLLLPAGASGRPWGLTLRGPNALQRIPFSCSGEGQDAARSCRAEGKAETLRRVGARVNAR